jgi:hypothetical protein
LAALKKQECKKLKAKAQAALKKQKLAELELEDSKKAIEKL